ncbi:unnamed protein product, partial [Fusarium graminearum]
GTSMPIRLALPSLLSSNPTNIIITKTNDTMPGITIRWEDPGKWQSTMEQVDQLLEQHTGHKNYPSTKSIPPIIFGVNMPQKGIDELKGLDGVIAVINDDG